MKKRIFWNATNQFLMGLLCAVGVTVLLSSTASAISGLDFPGNGSGTVRFKFINPHLSGLPIYGPGGNGVTYIWRAYPRQQSGYYTTFFWANDDGKGTLHSTFYWPGNDAPDTYYGAHPYPPNEDRTYHEWEIAVYNMDIRDHSALTYNRWHTQVFMAWEDENGFKCHKYYWDWPDQSKVIYYTTETPDAPNYGETNPPYPALTWGDAPWNPGNEVYCGIIRGIQIYNRLLSLSDIASELSSPLSSAAGAASIWYLNINPTPTDISDKSGRGHHPVWVGSERPALYKEGGDTTPPSAPRNFRIE